MADKESPNHKFDEDIENRLATIVLDNEVAVVAQNRQTLNEDFEAYMDLFDAIRAEKDYSWMSDIFIPEFISIILAQIADEVSEYFQTRDFVECYVQDESDEAVNGSKASQECTNRTLNRRKLYHYQKYVRARLISKLIGEVVAVCWWEQDIRKKPVPITDPDTGETLDTVKVDDVRKDCFNYDVVDPRNVFYEDVYTYSLQEKDFVTIREETTYDKLRKQRKSHGYFNLNLVKDIKTSPGTKTKSETRGRDNPSTDLDNDIAADLDKYTRYGNSWFANGKPGIDSEGNVMEGATLEECVTTFVVSGSTKVLIGFHKQPYKDHKGDPYRPLLRGLCYIHPTADGGAGDGKYAREMSIAINDTFNLTNDRTRLATMPTLKVKKYGNEDMDSVYFAPEHAIEVTDPADIQEFKIDSDISGGMTQLAVLTDKMRQVTGTQPPDLGQTPALSSTTATAASLASAGTSKRNSYKSMSFENTFLADMYWMILQMTWQLAKPETGQKLMGAKVFDFDPDFDYYYRPLSQSIESENSKNVKIQRYTTLIQTYANLAQINPTAIDKINSYSEKIEALMGDEVVNASNIQMDPEPNTDGRRRPTGC